jgi:DNA-binding IclR family transcriptional regulator
MNSLRRMLDVLDLFKSEQPVIDIELVCSRLGYAQASAYRYVRELTAAGLLVRLPRGYALGPRIIELDRLMTDFHPILVAGRELVRDLADQTGLEVLISELYGASVIAIYQHSASNDSGLHFGRGRPMDLFRSATAKVILAYLLPRQLRRLYDERSADAGTRLGTWKDFSRDMLQVRKDGYCVSEGELDPGVSGIAAPIFDEKKRILGSLTLVGRSERFRTFDKTYLSGLVMAAAQQTTERIASVD